MEEAEAEAVLLVLGNRLQWKEDVEHSGFFHGESAEASYKVLVFQDNADLWEAWRSRPSEDFYAPNYKTCDAAKLACERHHATGKWEAEHFTEVPE